MQAKSAPATVTVGSVPVIRKIKCTVSGTLLTVGQPISVTAQAFTDDLMLNPMPSAYISIVQDGQQLSPLSTTDGQGKVTLGQVLWQAAGTYNVWAQTPDGAIKSNVITITVQNITTPPPPPPIDPDSVLTPIQYLKQPTVQITSQFGGFNIAGTTTSNLKNKTLQFYMIFQLKDSDGFNLLSTWSQLTLLPGQTSTASAFAQGLTSGKTYTAYVYLWSNLDSPVAYANVGSKSFVA